MTVVIPIAAREVSRAKDLLQWIGELGGCNGHRAVLLFAHPVTDEDSKELVQLAAAVFSHVEIIRQKEERELGWPLNANALFHCAADFMRLRVSHRAFLWMEIDSIPLSQDWLNRLDGAYAKCGRPFMGAIYNHPHRHMNGVAIYPYNIANINPWMSNASKLPFDLAHTDIALAKGRETNLIVRSLKDHRKNLPHSFPTVESLSVIPNGCVLFHGNKDGTLIQRLREKNGHTHTKAKVSEPFKATRNPSSITFRPWMLSKTKLDLEQVTIWAAAWSDDKANQEKTIRVLRYCDRIIKPEKFIFFSHLPVTGDQPFDVIRIPKLDWKQWNPFVNRTVPNHIKDSFALSVHEDGFPVDMECWNEAFLEYDYIGATWQDGIVGNGGFNIESPKLMNAKTKLPLEADELVTASDMFICRNRAEVLKKQGIRFAPRDLALTFSSETFGNSWPSFGFHGRNWATEKYRKGWKLIEASER